MRVLVRNGPNLNLLGTRESEVYGSKTLADVQASVEKRVSMLGVTVEFLLSNHEGDIMDAIRAALALNTLFGMLSKGNEAG